jgi:hypothetical protein
LTRAYGIKLPHKSTKLKRGGDTVKKFRCQKIPYYTERATLGEAIALNNVENDIEFVNWGEELPFDREGCRQ